MALLQLHFVREVASLIRINTSLLLHNIHAQKFVFDACWKLNNWTDNPFR